MSKLVDIAGKRIGRWTVLSFHSKTETKCPDYLWLCRCDCGTERLVRRSLLRTNRSLCCGCISGTFKHGKSQTLLYEIWSDIKARCYRKSHHAFNDYGGRGIAMHEQWRQDFQEFDDYVHKHLGKRPGPNYSLDRMNNNKGYEPDNLRWATKTQQARNSRRIRELTYNGKTQSTVAWAEELKIPAPVIRSRLFRGDSDLKALTMPYKPIKRKAMIPELAV